MLDDKLLEPLNSGHLMINPRVKDSAKELCEQLIDIYMAENDETESKITAQNKDKNNSFYNLFLKCGRKDL